MSEETIVLLKNYDPKQLSFPAAGQQKFDGVPVRIINNGTGVVAVSRQGEVITSINHILTVAKYLVLQVGASIVGELYVPGLPFKDISGLVRQTKKQSPSLMLYVFDFDLTRSKDADWFTRHNQFSTALSTYLSTAGQAPTDCPIRLIPSLPVLDDAGAVSFFNAVMEAQPQAEGVVFHSYSTPFKPGKRDWGTQRMKPVPTIDLKIMGFEEAVSKTGMPMGMVGRLNAEFTRVQPSADGSTKCSTTIIGIGPGALTHKERQALWTMQKQGRWKPHIAEIKYMRDDTYDALRQPTFVRFRTDKQVADTFRNQGKGK